MVPGFIPDTRFGTEGEHVYQEYTEEGKAPYHVDGFNTPLWVDWGQTASYCLVGGTHRHFFRSDLGLSVPVSRRVRLFTLLVH